ncbi:hypothetical protein KY284_014089 [Solanum tuberosum]|nr:hypothetical protein KY284_014089 [Solanum tuberosum]
MAIQKVLLFLFLHIQVLNIVAQLPDLRYRSCDNYGFYYDSIGQNTDEVSGIVLCRGDVELKECRSCIHNAAQKLVQLCPTQKEVIGGYDECLLHYSNLSIINTQSLSVQYFRRNTVNASNPRNLTRNWCTPDLSPQNCLTDAYGTMPQCPCLGKRGGRIIGPRCNFRYESYRFFVDVPLDAPPPADEMVCKY